MQFKNSFTCEKVKNRTPLFQRTSQNAVAPLCQIKICAKQNPDKPEAEWNIILTAAKSYIEGFLIIKLKKVFVM